MFHTIPVSSVIVSEDRQRKEFKGIEELADSISRLGLIHPIVVTRDNVLVAGERRLRAHRHLGLPTITVQYREDLDEAAAQAIELEENIKRVDITWDERCRAIAKYHAMRAGQEPAWTQEDTARELGISPANVSRQMAVAEELANGNSLVAAAPKFSTAAGLTERMRARREASAITELRTNQGATNGLQPAHDRAPILVEDFISWADAYNGPSFNVIHCDFPYGIGAGSFDQGSGSFLGGYEDSPDTYWELVRALARNIDRIAHEQAHLIFWFSPKYFTETRMALSEMGWTILDYPLIWNKVNQGIIPDPRWYPRQIYEMAFFGHRGGANIIRSRGNIIAAPGQNDIHMSEKSQVMLEHFLSMIVDDTTAFLDPTCGSGSALRAAKELGARRIVGLEKNPDFAERAIEKWNQTFQSAAPSNTSPPLSPSRSGT